MDRERHWKLADDVRIYYQRSSAHPIRYAITLRVFRREGWQTVRLFDNAHGVEEHHEHRYVGDMKQPPAVIQGDTNWAMAAALDKVFSKWPEILDAWERGS